MRATTKATFAGLAVSAAIFAASPASAQGAGGCGITQAADAAVQRQIALLDAAKVDSSEFFNGANSCLGSNLLDSLDLSNLIPTSFDFLGGAADQMVSSVIAFYATGAANWGMAGALGIVLLAAGTTWWAALGLLGLIVLVGPVARVLQGARGPELIRVLKVTGIAEVLAAVGVLVGTVIG